MISGAPAGAEADGLPPPGVGADAGAANDAEMAALRALAALLPARAAQHALLGTLAVLLGRGLCVWGGEGSERWARGLLDRLMRVLARERDDEEVRAQLDALDNLMHAARTPGGPEPGALAVDVPHGVREGVLGALVAACAFAPATHASRDADADASGAASMGAASTRAGACGGYDARARQLLKGLCAVLQLPPAVLTEAEDQLAARVAALATLRTVSAASPRHGRGLMQAASIAGAAALGGVLIAATAGLAAPAVGVGLAALSGVGGVSTAAVLGPISAFLGTAAGTLTFTSLFGATGAGLAGYRLDRRIRHLSDFTFARLDAPPAEAQAEREARHGAAAAKRAPWSKWQLPSPWAAAAGGSGDAQPQPQPAARSPLPAEAAPIEPAAPRLAVLIAISGWRRTDADSVESQWRGDGSTDGGTDGSTDGGTDGSADGSTAGTRPYTLVQPHAEPWALVWERAELLRLGIAVDSTLSSEAGKMAAGEVLKHTSLAALMAALAVPSMLIKVGEIIDNPWAVAAARAHKAGVLLADVLLARTHGARPVSFAAIGLGARVALSCAHALDRAGDAGLGLIEDMVLLGAPVETRSDAWAAARRVSAGAVVSCYCANDWVLALLYRANSPGAIAGVGGLHPIPCPGVRSVDVSDLVRAHTAYSEPATLRSVLARVGARDGAASADGGTSEPPPSQASAAHEHNEHGADAAHDSVCLRLPVAVSHRAAGAAPALGE
ncbi:hypothetical protein KFE25_007420 [Diacronema lutheri]|uniref:Uncharacterized protein n=1 Tax=Diacronema lutheri TaxID=2081491 RepID=A0A8J5XV09_DIALT|nr:hypothetical protein KFE25_007420 [Diacronema lutheri]